MSPLFRDIDTGALDPQTMRIEGGLYRQLRWIVALRMLTITSIVLAYFLYQLTASADGFGYDTVYTAAGIGYVACLLYLVLLGARRPRAETQAYVQFVGDLFLITGLVYHFFDGTSSPFSILYLVVITLASVILRRRAGMQIATLAWILYALVALAVVRGWAQPPGLELAANPPLGRLAYYLAIHLLGFYAIAHLTSRLAQNVAQAEQALRRKGRHLAELRVAYRDVIESIPSGLVTANEVGILTSANAAAQLILDRTSVDLIGRPVYELGIFGAEEWSGLRDNAHLGERNRRETQYRTDSGDEITIGYSVSPLTGGSREPAGYILIFQDLSEWQSLQERVRLQERMAAVGQMASGLAHEIGNPLAAISGSVQMLSGQMPESSSERKLLEIIHKESQRLDRTIKGFLKFAKPNEASSTRFNVTALVAENVELLRNSGEIDRRHEIRLELAPEPISLLGDPDQISQIFWNLVRNAVRAMEDGGVLEVAGRAVEDRFQLDVRDSGRGMTAEQKDRVFHPFRSYFDGGSGIGMAIVYRIVEEHGGEIQIESAPGEGTRVRITLPGAVPETESLSA